MKLSTMTTLSIDSCKLTTKCPGCYLEHIKGKVQNTQKTYHRGIIDVAFENLFKENIKRPEGSLSHTFNINISTKQDMLRLIPFIVASQEQIKKNIENFNLEVRIITPPIFVVPLIVTLCKNIGINLCLTINAFYPFISPAGLLVVNDQMKFQYEIELSFNSSSNKFPEFESLLLILKELNPRFITMNYIHTDKTIGKKEIIQIFENIEKKVEPIEVRQSPCVTAGIGELVLPCEETLINDILITETEIIKNTGCPFPEKSCQLS